ncbi:MAG TPA: protein kinase [Candidatus Obscuribacterales bacterium]
MPLTLLNNRYRIIQALGAGGFGKTFLAEDTHMPSARRCVIKQLKPVTHDPQAYQIAQQRFQREAAVLEELGEGNNQIPKLYAYFSEAGEFYLVQEWIEGDTLTKKVQQQGAVSEAAVRDMLLSLLPVLDYVHSKRIIHRDIKPDNIIVRHRDGKPVLIDFGAVKEAMGNVNQSIVIGTPGFMPIEQTAGQPVYASDIYGLGMTAVYLLTGKMPQELQADPQTGDILWHGNARSVSSGLVAVLDRAIQSNARDRFPTAREMLKALQSGAVSPTAVSPSMQATVAVAPHAPSPINSSPQNSPVIASSGGDWQGLKPWLLWGLIIFFVVGTVVTLSRMLNKSPEVSPQVASSSAPVSRPTAREETSSDTASSSSQSGSDPDTTTREIDQTPSRTPASSSPQPAQKTPTPIILSPSPAGVGRTKTEPQASPSPVLERSPSPSPTLTTRQNSQNQNSSTRVPAFPTGTPRSTVEATLGKPVKVDRGLWGNTHAVTYRFVPKQIDLGYLIDRNSGRIRQTEVSFAQSVDPQVMLTTVDELLNGEATEEIKQGLLRVQQGRSNSFTSNLGALKVQIVRQDCDFIYISIWDGDFHNFNVASSRRC